MKQWNLSIIAFNLFFACESVPKKMDTQTQAIEVSSTENGAVLRTGWQSKDNDETLYLNSAEKPLFLKHESDFNLKKVLLKHAKQLGISKIESERFNHFNFNDYFCKQDSAYKYILFNNAYVLFTKNNRSEIIIRESILNEKYSNTVYQKIFNAIELFRKRSRSDYARGCFPEDYDNRFYYVAKKGNRLYFFGLGRSINLTFPPPNFSVENCIEQDSNILLDDIYEFIQKAE